MSSIKARNIKLWNKGGFIYCPSGKFSFDISHAHKPTPYLLNDETIRIFFGTRDRYGVSRTTYIDVSANNPKNIVKVSEYPVLDIGEIGAFDDSGVNVSSLIELNGNLFMYYIGWNPRVNVSTINAIGLAVSKDHGNSFTRCFHGPILDRNKYEPFYTGAVDVKYFDEKFFVWYTSGIKWEMYDNKPEIHYLIKTATSLDAINFSDRGTLTIKPNSKFECLARPSVIQLQDDQNRAKLAMYFSKRDFRNFRTNPKRNYRAGYAESFDGLHWDRLDEDISIVPSTLNLDFDSEAIAYPYVIDVGDKYYRFYNGSGFGRTGFGYAWLDKKSKIN